MVDIKDGDQKFSSLYLDPCKVGAALVEVGVDFQKIDSREIQTRWFRDALSETDVFVWVGQNKKILKQQVSMMGLIAEWNIMDGVKTGMIMESEISAKDLQESGLTPDDTASEVIRFDEKVQPRTLGIAISIIENSKTIEPVLIDYMLKNFRQHSLLGKMSHFTESKRSQSSKSSLWLRAKTFILSCFRK